MSSKPYLKKITSFLLAIAVAVMLISISIPVQTVAAADHVCSCVGVVKEYLGITAAIGNGSQTAAWFLKNGWVETRNPVKGDVVVMWAGYPGADSKVGHVGIFQDMSHLWQNKTTGDENATPPCSNAGSVAWRSFNMNSSLIKFYSKQTHVTVNPSLTASPSSVYAGNTITVSWSNLSTTGNDWISMHPASAPDSNYLTWQSVKGSSGSLNFQAPSSSGSYNFRLFRNGTKVATSNAVAVAVNVTVNTSLAASPASAYAGNTITVSWSNLSTTGNDWISMHPAGAPDSNYLTWQSVKGSSGSLTFQAPSSSGSYDFRLFRNGTKVATSNAVMVSKK